MPVETATYISQLNTSYPANSDGLNEADNHMRLIKQVLQAQFPNFTAAALSATQAQLDAVVADILTRSGGTPAGQVADFAMATAPTGWLECNGAAVSRTTYAALFTAIGTTWGAGDGSTTFNLPPDRYRRGRTAAGAVVGTLQADQNKSHTHTGTASGSGTTSTVSNDHTHAFSWSGTTSGFNTNHTHTFSGTTAGNNESLDHSHGYNKPFLNSSTTGGGAFGIVGSEQGATTGGASFGHGSHGHNYSGTTSGANVDHSHTYSGSGSTGGISANHSHTWSFSNGFTTSTGSADGAEARPNTAVFLTCIKT